jgi:hypothetical protein
MSKKLTIFLVILGVLILIAFFGYYIYMNYYLPSIYHIPPKLANVDFPTEEKQYPTDWPNELKFPDDFLLVDFTSGTMPENSITGWSIKLRYQGKPSSAVEMLSTFFEDSSWTIVENDELDFGGFLLLIQREQGNGVIVIEIDPDNSLQTLVIATIFLP